MNNSLLVAVICTLAVAAACNYTSSVMYVDIANHSGHVTENIEVRHPTRGGTGLFGLPNLRPDQVHRRLIPVGTPCRFSMEFDDQSGKHYAQSFDLGAKCPEEVVFEIGGGMKVSERVAKP